MNNAGKRLLGALLLVLAAKGRAAAMDIHDAVLSNDVAAVNAILERTENQAVYSTLGGGVTPLHLASVLDDEVITGLLLCSGADADSRTDGGFTPLHWAAGRNATKSARLLLAAGADVNAGTAKGITPLHWAAGKNSEGIVKLLINAGAHVDQLTSSGLTPLHWAVMHGSEEACIVLAYTTVARDVAEEVSAVDREYEQMVPPPYEEPGPGAGSPSLYAQPRILPGRTLMVDIGLGESIEFVWIRALELWFGKYEITNGQYRRFKPRHDSLFREDFSLNGNRHPAVQVSWYDAKDFCKWLNRTYPERIPPGARFRLPTELEWMTVASCGEPRKYPWGDRWPPPYGNYADLTSREHLVEWMGIRRYDDGHVVTCPVSESGANEWAVFGVGGNAWEWCENWYDRSRTYKVRKGGSWDFDQRESLTIIARGFDRPEARYDTIGLRLIVGPKD
ncbi:SUMF1/EgtB/PvdO family nonheme iron enzyme [Verrucomicrobiota bacterium]